MAKKISDLRTPRPASPPPPSGQRRDGQLPLPVGRVMLTDFEKKHLKEFGWKEGDPLPANLAQEINRVIVEANEPQMPVPADTPPVAVPEPIDLENLPAEKRQEIQSALALAKEQKAIFDQYRRASVPQAGPGVNEAIAAAVGGVTIVNDLKSEDPLPPATEGASLPSEKEAETTTPDQAGGAALPTHCPHCNWDLSLKDDLPVAEEDKVAYLISILGMRRFCKTVPLLGGHLVVVFRSLTARESDLAYRQIVLDAQRDQKNQATDSTDTYWRNLMTYRMIMGIQSVWTKENGTVEIDEIDNMKIDEDMLKVGDRILNTKLYPALPAIIEAAVPTETLRRVVGAAHHRFQLLVEKLEAMAEDPNFWPAIEEPR